MSQSYLEIAKQGKNSWWRYILGILLIFFIWLIIGGLFTGILAAVFVVAPLVSAGLEPSQLQEQIEQQILAFLKNPSVETFITFNIQFVFFWLAILLVIIWLHKRKLRTLISADATVNIKRLLFGFGVWLIMQVILIGLGLLLEPQNYTLTFQPAKWFLLLPFALILTPIQTSAEELFFRAYLIQGLSLLTRNKFILITATSILFMLLHLFNPEVQRGLVWLALYYFSFGAFNALITLKDNRLELAMGIHAAHNLSLFLFTNAKDSVIPTPSIWTIKNTGDPKFGVIIFLIECAIFYYLVFVLGKKKVTVSQVESE